MKPEELSERLLEFAVNVGAYLDGVPDTRLGHHVAGQLVRSATSPAPNYEEACAAESRADFIHKMSVCLKELRESRLWLRMLARSGATSGATLDALLDEATQLSNIVGQSIVTAKRNATHDR